ncbi:MAG: CBS domain-containing protein [Candidatus Bathyarchaeota archaeon]|nr:MAG: CBS domain-containing protein [Candidatus Bathyarchaeota archaeon]
MSGTILVRDIMTRSVQTVGVSASVREAVLKMNKYRIGSIVVIGRGKPVGIVTERDILERIVEPFIDPRTIGVKEIMSSPVVTIPPDTSIEEAATLMAKNGIKKLPVMEDERLVGIVTTMDLMRAGPRLINVLEELLRVSR